MNTIRGVVPVIPIPFLEDERIDEASFRRTVDFVAARGLGALCLPAYGSEFYKLTEAEREWLVATAVEVTAKRIPVIAQANHGSAKVAADLARRYEKLGADVISFALPRLFALSDADLLRYAGHIADAVSVPILVQDFNPGGRTIGSEFIATLHRQHANFQYAKLEEPMIVDKLVSIADTVGKAVSILEGWGGYYMLESLTVPNCVGIMPGVPLGELLDRVYQAHRDGNRALAYKRLSPLLPFINFTLQNMEVFLQVEKRLLVRRGLFAHSVCRAPSVTLSPPVSAYVDFLIEQIMAIGREEIGAAFADPTIANSNAKELAS